jgi:hypothetical protein
MSQSRIAPPPEPACVARLPNNGRIIVMADNNHVPSGEAQLPILSFAYPPASTARFLRRSPKGVYMVHRNNAGKLLLFPAPARVPGSPTENWGLRILETKDNLISALEFLQIAYNEMLAGRPARPVDEVLARVEAIVRNDAKVPAYTVVAALRIHGSISPEPKRRVPLLFPAV